MFNAYLEDFNDIKIIINRQYDFNTYNISIKSLLTQGQLKVVKKEYVYNHIHLYCISSVELDPHIDYNIEIEMIGTSYLQLGKITRSSLFDQKYYFDGWLGYQYHKDCTTFRLWSPTCKEIKINVDNIEYDMIYQSHGLWEIQINKDLESKPYFYKFRINQTFDTTLDPYANSSCANNKFNYVIDLNKTYQNKYDYYQKDNFSYNDAIIYELNIRDATSKKEVDNLGKYDTLTNSINENYGLGYIKKLGITHLQLLPIFAFGGVDEIITDNSNPNFKYNWGYNPMQYNIPSGFYSNNPDDPYLRINELKKLIDQIHSLSIGVNMDVVFNHVYDHDWFPMEKLVPGYTFRTDERGFLTDSSWCGNDLATDHLMIRKLITDSITFYQKFYKIDGFRFDLMGLIDIDTIKEINDKVKKINPYSMLYGEGWNMDVKLDTNLRANMNNSIKLKGIGFFNDYFRNMLRGNNQEIGYAIGKKLINKEILKLIKGFYRYDGEFIDSCQSINYVECHDNYTFYDLCKVIKPDLNEKELYDYSKLAISLIIFSEGIPFIHAGQELLRSKNLIDNSYNQNDDVNGIDWYKKPNLTNILIDLIKIRKENDAFRIKVKNEISKRILLDSHNELPKLRLSNQDGTILQMIISNSYDEVKEYFAPGTTLIFDGEKKVNIELQCFIINKPGVYLFKK